MCSKAQSLVYKLHSMWVKRGKDLHCKQLRLSKSRCSTNSNELCQVFSCWNSKGPNRNCWHTAGRTLVSACWKKTKQNVNCNTKHPSKHCCGPRDQVPPPPPPPPPQHHNNTTWWQWPPSRTAKGPRGCTITRPGARHHRTPSEVFSTHHCLRANMPHQSAIYLPSRMEDWPHASQSIWFIDYCWHVKRFSTYITKKNASTITDEPLITTEKQPRLGDTLASFRTLFLGLKQALPLIKIKYHYLLLGHLLWHSRADVLHHYTPVKFGQWGKTPCYGSPGQHLLKSEAPQL